MRKFFFKEFLKNSREIGSIMPSSQFLVRQMLADVDFERARTIVELGPGLGPITKELLRRMNPKSTLIVIEMNEGFCEQLRKIADLRLVVVHASALDIGKFLEGRTADYVISGLPLASLPRSFAYELCAAINGVLAPDGQYVQFQYSLASYLLLKKFFRKVAITFTLLNIPPAFVYRCGKVSVLPR
jgi:phospholipid N-methyltransferase